ncbi:MAG: GTPase Era [Eubacteriales bacterium]|nr:GTPase Era [Eubacteriales bacterium]
MSEFKAGYVALVGRPNVGKSTVLNNLLGFDLAITTPKAQTTRNMIRGVLDYQNSQMVFLDTPGFHEAKNLLDRYMLKSASLALGTADVIVFIIEAGWKPRIDQIERQIIEQLKRLGKPSILLINKVDIAEKAKILPLIDCYAKAYDFNAIIPISAKTKDGLEILLEEIKKALPESEKLYSEADWTDQSERVLARELLREALLLELNEELPYGTAVRIEDFSHNESGKLSIEATVVCEEVRHRPMILGREGQKIRQIGSRARQRIQEVLDCEVDLFLTVKPRKAWRESLEELSQLGYDADELK